MKIHNDNIIEGLKKGNEESYRFVYDNYYVFLCKIAYEYLKDDFLAKTIVGDTIFHIWEIRSKLEINSSLKNYLIRSVRNKCLNFIRQKYLNVEIPIIESIITMEADPTSSALLEKELEREIYKAIDRLPNESKQVFILSRFHDKKYDEIADELNISVNTVKYHIKRALAKLHEDLAHYLFMIFVFFHQIFK